MYCFPSSFLRRSLSRAASFTPSFVSLFNSGSFVRSFLPNSSSAGLTGVEWYGMLAETCLTLVSSLCFLPELFGLPS